MLLFWGKQSLFYKIFLSKQAAKYVKYTQDKNTLLRLHETWTKPWALLYYVNLTCDLSCLAEDSSRVALC